MQSIIFINYFYGNGTYNTCFGTGDAGHKARRKMGQGVPVERDRQPPEGEVQESVWYHPGR